MEFKFSNRISGVQGSAIREIFKYGNRPEVISLAGGNPAPELFPAKEFSDILADILAKKRSLIWMVQAEFLLTWLKLPELQNVVLNTLD